MKSETTAIVWKCAYCDKEFKYESEKRRHEQSHVPQFECKVCSKKFSFVSALRRHEKQHERTESVQCSKCGGRFRDETLLKRHMQYAHRGIHSCKKCDATFNSELAVRTHMKTHMPESERKFRCSYNGCSKTFNFAHHLKHHERTHTNDKPHVCTDCGKRFIQLHHLKIHQRVHEPDSWLMCTVLNCHKEFTNEYALRRHIATHIRHSQLSFAENKSAKRETLPYSTDTSKLYMIAVKLKETKPIEIKQDSSEDTHCTEITKYIKELSVNNSPDDKIESVPFNINENSQIENVSQTVENKKSNIEYDPNLMDETTAGDFEEFKNGFVEENVDVDDLDLSISSCKSVIGKCIVTGDTDTNENCLCAQMNNDETTEEFNKVIPPKNNNVRVNLMDDLKCIEKRRKDANACETCECASTCGIRDKAPKKSIAYETPELEFRKDGIIKIKDTFDIDIDIVNNDSEGDDVKNDCKQEAEYDIKPKVSLMSSCKDVLGNCIVSGDGTIGEGCLCARMTANDQQMIAEEIEEITPCPQRKWY